MKLAHVGQDNMCQSFRAVYNVISLKGLCNVVSTLTFATDSSYSLRTAFLPRRLCPGKSVLQFCLSCTNPVRHQRRLPVLVAALAWRVRQTGTPRVLYIQAQPVCKNCHTYSLIYKSCITNRRCNHSFVDSAMHISETLDESLSLWLVVRLSDNGPQFSSQRFTLREYNSSPLDHQSHCLTALARYKRWTSKDVFE